MQLIDTFRFRLLLVSFSILTSPLYGRFNSHTHSDSWQAIQVPGVWEESGLKGTDQYDGFAWYRCWVTIPAAWLKNDVFIATEQIDNVHEIRFNGHRVGGRGAFPPNYENGLGNAQVYLVDANLLHPDKPNLITFRVYDADGRGGFTGAAPAVISDDQAIALRGKWQFRLGNDADWATADTPQKGDYLFAKTSPLAERFTLTARGGLTRKAAWRSIRTPADLQVAVVLSEPAVTQPLHLKFDERGRLWVVQYRQYPHPAGLKIISRDEYWRNIYDHIPEPPPNHTRGLDRITIHEDTNADGTFDKHTVFVDGLNLVTSLAHGRGGVWVLNPPYLLFYPDRDRNDVPDGDPEVRLKGFWLEDTHSIANSLRWGPDGWLYGAQGSTVSADIVVYDADGQPQDEPAVHSIGQLIWRYHPERRKFEIWAEGGGNAFGCEIDSKGRIFSGHNGGDTRGYHYPQHAYLRKGFTKHGPLSNPYAFGFFPHMQHHPVARFTHTFEIYEGTALPTKYHGSLFGVDPINRNIPIADIKPRGATFQTHDRDLAMATEDTWFRPVDIKSGPDGALYVCDWYDQNVNHLRNHQGLIDKSTGRIYRIHAQDYAAPAKINMGTLPNEELIEYLVHPNRWHRQTALRVIGDRADRALIPLLTRQLLAADGQAALEYLWAVNLSHGFDEALARQTLAHADPYVRAWTVRLLGDSRRITTDMARQMARQAAQEEDVEVRSQMAASAQRFPAEQALPIVATLWGHEADNDDPYLPLQLWWALESHCAAAADQVVALGEDAGFWKNQLVQTHILPRLMRRFAATGRRTDLLRCADLLVLAPTEEATRQLLAGFEAGIAGAATIAWPEELVSQIARTGQASLALRLRQRQADAMQAAVGLIGDDTADANERAEIIRLCGELGIRQSIAPLLKLIRDAADSAATEVALAALGNFDDPQIPGQIIEHYPRMSVAGSRRAQMILASRSDWALAMLRAIQEERIDAVTITVNSIQQCLAHNEIQINKLVQSLFGSFHQPASSQLTGQVTKLRSILEQQEGNPYDGRILFREKCEKCHRLFERGGAVGPDLTSYQRTNLDTMLLSIAVPSAEIRAGFENYTIATDDGRVLTGLLIERTPNVVTIRDAEGQTHTIDRSQVEELRVNPQSLMPTGLLDDLPETDLRNLFAYLRSAQPLNK